MAQAKIRIMAGRRAGITSLPAFTGPQETSAAFVQGAPVKISSGNLVAVSTTSAGSLLYLKKSSTANVVGFAQGTARASVTENIVVARIQEGAEFEGNLIDVSASSAKTSKVGSTAYLAKVSADTHWGFTLNTPGASSSSYVQGKVTGLIDAASTVNGRVSVQLTVGGALKM
jgi:hypothetical protein